VQGASPWAVVLIPSDILGWTVYPTIYITLDCSNPIAMTQGFIYILTNQAMPGIVKVGKTTGNPTSRASQLSSATGVPVRFSIFRQYAVVNCDDAEEFAHRMLERVFGRPNNKREFFSGGNERCGDLAR
jgi:hypothetical protein